jgi:hypothetical protein
VPIAPIIPPAPKPTCNFSLSWDAANSILKANLQIGDCRVQPNVKIPIDMDTTKDSPDTSFSKLINNLTKLNKL